MFDGGALSDWFDSEGTSPDFDLPHERLELLKLSTSYWFHVGPEFPCEFPPSVTLTVLLESPCPSVDAFLMAPFGPLTEPKPGTFFPAGKATLFGRLSRRELTRVATDTPVNATYGVRG